MVIRWSEGLILYEIDESLDALKTIIEEAMKRIEEKTDECVRFKPRRVRNKVFLVITKGFRCSSHVGQCPNIQDMAPKSDILRRESDLKQYMYLDPENCNMGIILHELCHVIGLYHEHQQPRRNDYVEIHFENILEEERIHFLLHNPEDIGISEVGRDFDYDSIMLYGETTFAKEGKIAMSSKTKATKLRDIDEKDLSPGDVMKIKELYRKKEFNDEVDFVHTYDLSSNSEEEPDSSDNLELI